MHARNVYEGVEVQLPYILVLALGIDAATRASHFTPVESTPSTHRTGGWVDLTASLDTPVKSKIKPLPGTEPQFLGCLALHLTEMVPSMLPQPQMELKQLITYACDITSKSILTYLLQQSFIYWPSTGMSNRQLRNIILNLLRHDRYCGPYFAVSETGTAWSVQ